MEATDVLGALEAGWPELVAMLAEHDLDPVNAGLPYVAMGAVASFLATKVRSGDTGMFGPFFDTVERCLHDGDDEAINLIVVGLLEGLQNSDVTELDNEVWELYLRPTTRRAWEAVEAFWNGDVGAISRWSLRQSR